MCPDCFAAFFQHRRVLAGTKWLTTLYLLATPIYATLQPDDKVELSTIPRSRTARAENKTTIIWGFSNLVHLSSSSLLTVRPLERLKNAKESRAATEDEAEIIIREQSFAWVFLYCWMQSTALFYESLRRRHVAFSNAMKVFPSVSFGTSTRPLSRFVTRPSRPSI